MKRDDLYWKILGSMDEGGSIIHELG